MLASLRCQNYRALHNIEIPLERLVAFVGPNGTGKSAALRAIDLILGDSWPGLNRVRVPQDFTDFDHTRPMVVQVGFDKPLLTDADALGKRSQIHHLRITCKPYKNTGKWGQAGDPNFDFMALDATESQPFVCTSAPKGRQAKYQPLLGVTSGLREQAPCILIDHHRSIAQQMPWNRGSVLGKLLAPAHKELDEQMADVPEPTTRRVAFRQRFEAAMEILRTPHVQTVEATINQTTQRTLGFLGKAKASDVSVGFGIADPNNPLNSFRLMYREGGIEVPAEEAGLGIQSAIVVGLFEALRQSRQKRIGTVLIDEPEMYLHPQAQRYFHQVLIDLVENNEAQVIYSTHSPIFADAYRFESLRLFRRPVSTHTAMTCVSKANREILDHDRARLLTDYDAARSEALFADAVLLVEGHGDMLAARETAKAADIDIDGNNLSVIACGGKTAIPFHIRLCQALEIPVCAMYDSDVHKEPQDDPDQIEKVRRSNERAARDTARIEEALTQARDRFVCKPDLEAILGATGKKSPGRTLQTLKDTPADQRPPVLAEAVLRLAELADCAPPPF